MKRRLKDEELGDVSKTPKCSPRVNLLSFYNVVKKPETPAVTHAEVIPGVKPFQVKEGMTLAPLHGRKTFTVNEGKQYTDEYEEFAHMIKMDGEEHNLKSLFVRARVSGSNNLFFPATGNTKPKLFQFHGSNRPPYFGTWRKKSKALNGRRGLKKSESTLKYDYDSDEEWEDEPSDAEECKSDEDVDEDSKDMFDDEDNDGFFVEHGYLSPEEGNDEDELADNTGGPDEHRKQRMQQRSKDWEESRRQKERRLKKRFFVPTLYGPSWKVPEKEINGQPNPILHLVIPGVVFDYSTITKKEESNTKENKQSTKKKPPASKPEKPSPPPVLNKRQP